MRTAFARWLSIGLGLALGLGLAAGVVLLGYNFYQDFRTQERVNAARAVNATSVAAKTASNATAAAIAAPLATQQTAAIATQQTRAAQQAAAQSLAIGAAYAAETATVQAVATELTLAQATGTSVALSTLQARHCDEPRVAVVPAVAWQGTIASATGTIKNTCNYSVTFRVDLSGVSASGIVLATASTYERSLGPGQEGSFAETLGFRSSRDIVKVRADLTYR